MSDKFNSQSLKEIFREDIELAKRPSNLHKLWEYFDDYSYSGSNQIAFWFREEDGKKFMYLGQPIGPTPDESIKLLEFRRSGDNGEIGHRGGGNKVNIYGHSANRVEIYIRDKNNDLYKSETNPNAIYKFATNEDITEMDFRARIDQSEFQTIKKKIEKREIPPWYTAICQDIKSALGFEPNYLMAFEFDEAPIDFTDKNNWNEFIALTRAKQYEPKIYFKNEVVGMKDFEYYENIDLLGRSPSVKENEMVLPLYVSIGTRINKFCIKIQDKFYNVDIDEEEISFTDDLKIWGVVRMFCIDKDYFKRSLTELNKYFVQKHKSEDFYGVYFDNFNCKLINPIPKQGSLGVQGKNNKIINGNKNSVFFRMVFEPHRDCSSEILESLTSTDKVKASTNFVDKSKTNYLEIIDFCKRRYQHKELKPENKKKRKEMPPKPVSKEKPKKNSGAYLVYLGKGLYKFGKTGEEKRLNVRLEEHRKSSIEKVKEFTGEILKKEVCLPLIKSPTTSPKAYEENVSKILDKYPDEITLYQSKSSENEIREYFLCNDMDFILTTIRSEVEELL
jgi:hypothetical protein